MGGLGGWRVGWVEERGSGKERHTLNYQVGTQRQWAHVAQHNCMERAHNDNRWAHNNTLNYQLGTHKKWAHNKTLSYYEGTQRQWAQVAQHSGETANNSTL